MTDKGEGKTIAIIDSGVIRNHNEFQSSVISEHVDIPNWTRSDKLDHGSHVASIVSGKICGIAPLARLRIYKVLNDDDAEVYMTPHEEELEGMYCCYSMAEAMYHAIANVDIICISLSCVGEWKDFYDDVIMKWTCRAAMKGTLVCVAVGNSGPKENSIQNVPYWCLTVGASTKSENRYKASLNLGNKGTLHGFSVYQPVNFSATRSYPLVDYGSIYELIEDIEKNGGKHIRGAIVVLRDHLEVLNSSRLIHCYGGVGLIIINDPHIDCVNCHATMNISHSAGVHLINYMRVVRKATGRINFTPRNLIPTPEVSVARVSSRGPCPCGVPFEMFGVLKPDVVDEGIDILGASNLDGEIYYFESGTSMATPRVAGIAAILMASHEWGSDITKSALMTTTNWEVNDYDGNIASVFAMGCGQVNGLEAHNPGLVYECIHSECIPRYLRSLGYSEEKICDMVEQVKPRQGSLLAQDLNYPSFAIQFVKGDAIGKKITCERRVTNIGKPGSSYRVGYVHPPGVKIFVDPPELTFTCVGDKLTYKVEFELLRNLSDGKAEGSITWSDGEHWVRSPVAVLQQDTLLANPSGLYNQDNPSDLYNSWVSRRQLDYTRRKKEREEGKKQEILRAGLQHYFIHLRQPEFGLPDDVEGWYHSFFPTVVEGTPEHEKPWITTACDPDVICGFFAWLSPKHLEHIKAQPYFWSAP